MLYRLHDCWLLTPQWATAALGGGYHIYVIDNASYSIYRFSISASLVSLYVYMNIANCLLLAFVAMGSPCPNCGHIVVSHALGASLLLAVFVRRVSGIFRSHDCWFGDTFRGIPIREPSIHYLASRGAHCADCSMRPKTSEK